MKTFAKEVTVVTPTMNRSRFIATNLQALNATGFGGVYSIGDSSGVDQFAETAAYITSVDWPFRIVHRHLPGKNIVDAVSAQLTDVETQYAIFMPDDDIVVPRTLERCIKLLTDRPDCSAVTGAAIILSVGTDRVMTVGRFNIGEYAHNDPVERLQAILKNYSPLALSLSRTSELRARWSMCTDIPENSTATDLAYSCLLVLQGKVIVVDDLLVVRQDHAERISELKDFFEIVMSDDWGISAQKFISIVGDQVQSLTTHDCRTAHTLVKKAFWGYVKKHLCASFASTYDRGRGRDRRAYLREIRWLRKLVRSLRSYLPINEGRFSLEALLRPSSPYHADFDPVYRAITSANDTAFNAHADETRT